MFYSSKWKDFSRGSTHSQAVEKFLGGQCQHHPGEIIHNWYSSPDGRLGKNDDAAYLMWSSCEPKYSQIKHIRACLTSFAAQICIEHAVRQAKNAVKPNNGLHVRLSAKGDSGSYSNSLHTDWADIGSNTVSRVGDIFRTHEPFLYDFLSCVASGKIDGDLVRKTRPIDIVVTHSIAALNFSLNRFANWATKAAGSNPNLWGKVFFDNTQRYPNDTSSLMYYVPVGTPWQGVAEDPSMEDFGIPSEIVLSLAAVVQRSGSPFSLTWSFVS
ncbi:hypothetical protein F5878DRAFT_570093, partial [Lentinula raphanica]